MGLGFLSADLGDAGFSSRGPVSLESHRVGFTPIFWMGTFRLSKVGVLLLITWLTAGWKSQAIPDFLLIEATCSDTHS